MYTKEYFMIMSDDDTPLNGELYDHRCGNDMYEELDFVEGLMIVSQNGRQFLIDEKGQLAHEGNYESIERLGEYFVLGESGVYNVMNKTKTGWLFNEWFCEIKEIQIVNEKTLFFVKTVDGYRIITSNGVFLTKDYYEKIYPFREVKRVLTKKDGEEVELKGLKALVIKDDVEYILNESGVIDGQYLPEYSLREPYNYVHGYRVGFTYTGYDAFGRSKTRFTTDARTAQGFSRDTTILTVFETDGKTVMELDDGDFFSKEDNSK